MKFCRKVQKGFVDSLKQLAIVIAREQPDYNSQRDFIIRLGSQQHRASPLFCGHFFFSDENTLSEILSCCRLCAEVIFSRLFRLTLAGPQLKLGERCYFKASEWFLLIHSDSARSQPFVFLHQDSDLLTVKKYIDSFYI